MAMVRIEPLNHRDGSAAAGIHAVLMLAYAQEAELLGVKDFAPLNRTLQDVQASVDFHLGALDGNEIVGVLSIGPDDEPDQLQVSSLVVHPKWQRRGIARTLLADAFRRAAGMNITVSTGAKNTPALALYREFGFVPYRYGTMGSEALALVKLRASAPSSFAQT